MGGRGTNHVPSSGSVEDSSRWQDLRLVIRDGWGTLTLHRPDQRNSMCPRLLAELEEATIYLADEAGVKGLVITGAGDSFSVGGDIASIRDCIHDPTTDVVAISRTQVELIQRAVLNIRRMAFPVVAAVNGLAAGSGFGLALACDDRIAAPRATFVAAYGAIGLSPDAGLSYLLPRIVGDARARAIILGDQVVRARRAERLGMVSEVVEADELLEVAMRRVRRLTRWAPQSVATTKQLLQSTWHEGFADHLQRERHLFADLCATANFVEGIEALHAGRPPRFEGR
ncbi:MAG TPA: enoyl-CoA hydratase/isomerase family protein [Solirubrobacterales bacterium]|nr:enoyl-CoA hydratase/isomerase family protein [Solirubrobacterales bacterium]